MITSYGPQASQMNKNPPKESSIDLTLPQHLCDEDLKLREVRPHLEIKPFRIWYDQIFLNSFTLVILLQVDPTFSDEPEIICESFYEIENTLFLHGLQFSTLDITIGCIVRFVDYFLITRQIT